jgi:O6-methylguanine-DNA--protein-cysteine methyltransferase
MRAVGTICKKNPFVIVVPCHRVVPAIFLKTHSQKHVGNYSNGGPKRKIELLKKEGIIFSDN